MFERKNEEIVKKLQNIFTQFSNQLLQATIESDQTITIPISGLSIKEQERLHKQLNDLILGRTAMGTAWDKYIRISSATSEGKMWIGKLMTAIDEMKEQYRKKIDDTLLLAPKELDDVIADYLVGPRKK